MRFFLMVTLGLFLIGCSFPQTDDVFPPVGLAAKVNNMGTMFGLNENECPFGDSQTSIDLYTSARGVKDKPAVQAMVSSGRIIFLPVGAIVDVLENDKEKSATKVRIRSGENIGREMWTHPKFISSIK